MKSVEGENSVAQEETYLPVNACYVVTGNDCGDVKFPYQYKPKTTAEEEGNISLGSSKVQQSLI